MKQPNLLIMFVRYPRLGEVKTRMSNPKYSAIPLSSEMTLDLYEAFLKDLFPRFRNAMNFDLWVMLGGATDEEAIHFQHRFSLEEPQLVLMPETPTDLGALMEHCFEQGFQAGYQRMALIGSDAPQILEEYIQQSFRLLDKVQMVIGPDNGGGMYLVGYVHPLGIMKKGIVWSQGTDREAVIQRCKAQSVSYDLLPEEIDMDTSDDLKAWYQQHHHKTNLVPSLEERCPHTFPLVKQWVETIAQSERE